ncbi:MAG: type II toxin-antitoxin system VapC family toxin [Candidatus Njordarchaeales archaeon]
MVIDASALAKYILKEPNWREIEKYLINAMSVDHVVKEVSNAIWKAYIRGFITIKDVEKKLHALMKLIGINIVLVNELELLEKAVEIAIKERIPVYDSLYIALAERERKPLITSDKKQAAIYEKRGGAIHYIE